MFYGLLYSFIVYWFFTPIEMSNVFFVMKCQHDSVRQPLQCGQKNFSEVSLEVAVRLFGIERCAGGCLPLIWAHKLAILTGSSLWFYSVTSGNLQDSASNW